MSGEPSSALNSSPTKTDESNTQVLSTPTSFSSKENKATASATPPVQRGGGGEASPQDQPKDKKTDVVKKQRRSARVLQHDPIVAPGFGTRKDLQRLARELSSDSVTFPVKAVEEMMKSRGRGIRRGGGDDSEAQDDSTAPAVSSAWADFMMEEGVQDAVMSGSNNGDKGKAEASSRGGDSTAKKRSYDTSAIAMVDKKPKKHDGGILVQAGTLDSTLVGRSKTKLQELYDLTVPTRIMGSSILIKSVVTSCTAVHSIAIDTNGRAYGWGRNEHSALGSHLPEAVVLPTRLKLASEVDEDDRVVSAAVGKGHTMLLMEDSAVYAVGWNKAGQCGVRTSTEVIPNFRKCVFEIPDVTIVQISCGEDFSVALDSNGYVYSTGSSEFGQLGNGETGEYFISANKLAFANCNVWTRRTTFCHAPNERLHSNNDKAKVVPLSGEEADVRIAAIACGKHHTLALEAASDLKPRVFSWGCGNYGCLGHGLQADEYYPRNIGALHNVATAGADVRISAGAQCSLLQTSNGHVYYWGKHRSVGEAVMRPQLVDVLANNQHHATFSKAGGQTVVVATKAGQCIAWGQGPHGELGLGEKKSSAKPTFVESLDGKMVKDLACGYGHTIFVVDENDAKKLPELDTVAAEDLIDRLEGGEVGPASMKGGKRK